MIRIPERRSPEAQQPVQAQGQAQGQAREPVPQEQGRAVLEPQQGQERREPVPQAQQQPVAGRCRYSPASDIADVRPNSGSSSPGFSWTPCRRF